MPPKKPSEQINEMVLKLIKDSPEIQKGLEGTGTANAHIVATAVMIQAILDWLDENYSKTTPA